jgi:tetratricopeptide (TPR) repeat protein
VTAAHEETTEFLLASLRDLEREREVGDIDDEDYRALRDDYTVRAAAALRAEQRGAAPPVPPPPRRSTAQRIAVVLGVVGFAVLAGVLVAQAVGRRDTGEGITGEITRTPTQAAGDCLQLSSSGDLLDAVDCYRAVLEDDPDNAVARTYLGWTLFLTARQAGDELPTEARVELYVGARTQLDRAVEADPGYADARAFQVVLAVQEQRWEEAARQLAAFDELDAPADMQNLVEPLRTEIEAGLAGGSTTTTTPTTSTAPG